MAKQKCPECGSGETYNRIKTADFRCKKCGNEWKKEKHPEGKHGSP